ncbi:MAG TPA: NACHT domain-containing protein [Ktedonobacteraceae bacterium]
MGGAGKTTLLHHLASWWQRTGLVQDVFYFGYDERAWNRQQIMHTIAKKLLDKYEMVTFQSLSLDAQQARLVQLLRSTRSLLILDNLESIIGAPLVLQHTLSAKEQEALRLLLASLASGQTLVLLGSRGAESWLARGSFAEHSYELAGLDQEAASQLTERILERHSASAYRSDPQLLTLMKLLDGFPLALEVVLANLAHQKPGEVLAALQTGDAGLEVGTSEKRTENILRCVDYSYRNLSPDAQQLLLCLAPFTSVIFRGALARYAEQLKQQPELAALPWEKWQEIIEETETWGLLNPDATVPAFLHIQPVLPYFLRHSLSTQQESGYRAAIEKAFYNHYTALSRELSALLNSKQPQERQAGTLVTGY